MNTADQPEFSAEIRARLAREPYLAPRTITDARGNRTYRVRRSDGTRQWINEEQMEALLNEILAPA